MKKPIYILASALFFAGPAGAVAGEPGNAQPSALVQVASARLIPMDETLSAYGKVDYAPQQSRVMDLQGEGQVRKVLVSAGERVHKGQALLLIRPGANTLLTLDQARIDFNFAQKNLQRLRDLRDRQLATNADVQVAEQGLAKARAVLSNLSQRRGATGSTLLRATMDGVVETVNVQAGQTVPPATPLLRLAKQGSVRIRLGVEPEDLSRLQGGQRVYVKTLYKNAVAYGGYIGEIVYQIDPQSRLGSAWVNLPFQAGLYPGTTVQGTIILRSRPQILAVPRPAVLFQGDKAYVYVLRGGHAWLRWVRSGQDDGRNVEIIQGLKAGEQVVKLGNYNLHNGMAVRLQAVKQ